MNLGGCICQFWLKLDVGRIPSTPAAIQTALLVQELENIGHHYPTVSSAVFTTSCNYNTLN